MVELSRELRCQTGVARRRDRACAFDLLDGVSDRRGDRSLQGAATEGGFLTERAPVTAIVASRNEASLLRRGLPELRFCDEVIVIDIDSSDDTAAVAEAAGAG